VTLIFSENGATRRERNYIARMRPQSLCTAIAIASVSVAACGFTAFGQSSKPPITLDEYFNTTYITSTALAPDGTAAAIGTEAPDWKNNSFRHDLWLWTKADGLRALAHMGNEAAPAFSPDGKWIAFESDRPLPGETGKSDDAGSAGGDDDKASRIWIIPVNGGEALPLYAQKLDAHSFAWSADGTAIYFSVTQPLTEEQKDAQKEEWKDVVRWREQHRGDLLLKQSIAPALAAAVGVAPPHPDKVDSKDAKDKKKSEPVLPPGAETIATSVYSINEIASSPDGKMIAFETEPVHHRMEGPANYEMYLVGVGGGEVKQITHNEGMESNLRWSPDSRFLHFVVIADAGTAEGKYRDVQGRLYRVDTASSKVERLGSSFDGTFDQFALLPDGREIAPGMKGTETQLYLVEGEKATKLPGRAGSYAGITTALHSNAMVVRWSTVADPTQVYLAGDPLHPDQLTALTSLNPVFAERAKPEWEPYTWTADDGAKVEGMLIYPPGKKGAKHLRMFTLIHGGPADADGNKFGADWYDWATLAATNGWLVFRPNYRGSSGYGDEFMLQIEPHLVSKPGKDILEGVDALVKDGIADPNHLAIGGYSYGGYMTNWLITQTTRFKSAVTGAGAVEHAANWGNDDESWDDAWYLGGRPWENPGLYQSEAALFQFDKVKTPTHLVQGGADIRVSFLEGETMERALDSLGIPHTFLVFPGEGHGLGKNPWHGYIKVREELKWLDKYDQGKSN
jgi:dipeptidyl aminopeptidase/acylaminoacyl peptidase